MENGTSRAVRIGTRGSALALWQANWVAGQLRSQGHNVALQILRTGGDNTSQPLNSMGGVGLFTREIQRALLADEVDIAVHSLKDLPTERIDGLELSVVPTRESAHDVLVTRSSTTVDELPQGARLGTGSMRRKAQLLHLRSDYVIEDIRGNVDTRLRKLDAGQYDGLILAEAGLRRLGLEDRITQRISLEMMVPAIGQGALGIEARSGDRTTHAAIQTLDDPSTHACILAERTLLAELLAGCLAPVGGHATVTNQGQMQLTGVVLSADGTQRIQHQDSAPSLDRESAIQLGQNVAKALRDQGADELIATARA